MRLENEAGIIIDSAPEGGGKVDAANVNAVPGEIAGTAFEQVECRRKRDARIGCERAQSCSGVLRGAFNGEEAFDQRLTVRRQRVRGAEFGLLDEAIGDLGNTAPADGADAGDR